MVDDYYKTAPAIAGTDWPLISWLSEYFPRKPVVLQTDHLPLTEPDSTPDSVKNPSTIDDDDEEEEGLPSPPLDEAFLASQTGQIELSQVPVVLW